MAQFMLLGFFDLLLINLNSGVCIRGVSVGTNKQCFKFYFYTTLVCCIDRWVVVQIYVHVNKRI